MNVARALCAAVAVVLAPSLATGAGPLLTAPAADASFDAGSLHVERYGTGDAVVLLPGLAGGTWEWSGIIRHLAPAHTVYAISLPGFDGRAAAKPPLFDRVTADVWSILEAQKIDRPVVIGHSLGGTLAIALGEQHADRLRGIVAIDALPVFPGTEGVTTRAERVATAAQFAAPIDGASHAEFLAYERVYMRTAGGVLDPALAGRLATLAATSDPRATAQWLREDVTADLRDSLAQITVPVLEIAPFNPADVANLSFKYTQAQKVAYYRSLLAGAPNVQVAPVSPARHFAMLDQPAKVAALLDAFLANAR